MAGDPLVKSTLRRVQWTPAACSWQEVLVLLYGCLSVTLLYLPTYPSTRFHLDHRELISMLVVRLYNTCSALYLRHNLRLGALLEQNAN